MESLIIYNMVKTRAELTEQLKGITTNVVNLLGSEDANKALNAVRNRIVSKYINKLNV
jgi:hypothetical protein